MADIFISYSKSDHALALKLSAFLESEGWTVWWDKSLGAADLYRDEIMKQLVAARAVISIWTPNSIKSDWVRAEAGRAKADAKLIPVKTSELTYAEIPLPFGEMHTENITSTDLIRAAVLAQLAKPAIPQSTFWQITGLFKYQVLTWIGIVGSAITLFGNLSGVLDMADWARELVAHWHEWNQIIWGWAFSLIGLKVPKFVATTMSFIVSVIILVVGLNLSARTVKKSVEHAVPTMKGLGILTAGLLGLVVGFLATTVLLVLAIPSVELRTEMQAARQGGGYAWGSYLGIAILICVLWLVGFPIVYLMWFIKQRSWALINSLLFLFMVVCLLLLPVHIDVDSRDAWMISGGIIVVFEICWMAVILFTPLQQLARRLGFVVLGVLTLVALSEISKLDLHRYLKPAKVSEISSPTHNPPSLAAA